MSSQEPSAKTGQPHLDSHEVCGTMVDHQGHEGVRFAAAVLYEKQRTQSIEDRRPEHDKEQYERARRWAVHISPLCLTRATEPLATPMKSPRTPERCGMRAAVGLLTSLDDGSADRTLHAMLPLISTLTNSHAQVRQWLPTV